MECNFKSLSHVLNPLLRASSRSTRTQEWLWPKSVKVLPSMTSSKRPDVSSTFLRTWNLWDKPHNFPPRTFEAMPKSTSHDGVLCHYTTQSDYFLFVYVFDSIDVKLCLRIQPLYEKWLMNHMKYSFPVSAYIIYFLFMTFLHKDHIMIVKGGWNVFLISAEE